MLRTLLRDESNELRVVEDPSAISDILPHKGSLLWLDLENPTPDEFDLIKEEFDLHPLAIEDAMSRHQRPKVDQYEHFYLVIFYAVAVEDPGATERLPGRRGLEGTSFVRHVHGRRTLSGVDGAAPTPAKGDGQVSAPQLAFDKDQRVDDAGSDERIVLQELTLFLGQNYIITVHDSPVKELEEAARRWSRNIEDIEARDGHGRGAIGDLPGTRKLSSQEKKSLQVQTGGPGAQSSQGDGARTSGAAPVTGVPQGGGRVGAEPQGQGAGQGQGQAQGQAQEEQSPRRDIGILLYSLLDSVVDNYFPVVDSIVDRVEMLEERIFESYSQEAIETIFTLKKDLLALRRVLAPERDVLNILTRRDLPIFDENTILYFQDVYDHVVRITDSIDTYRDLLSSALDSFLSMQSNKLNITVQTLTSVSIILMSVAAVTGWFGMNFEAMPELHTTWGYPAVIILVAVIVVVEFIFFKRKKWL